MGYPSASASSMVISQSSLPFLGAITLRTRWMRRSVREGAVFFQERAAGQEDVRVIRGLVQEQILDHDALHGLQSGRHMFGVGIGLQDILTLDVDALEGTVRRRIEHVGDAQARLVVEGNAPKAFEHLPGWAIRNVAVARQLMRERA